MIAIRGGSGLGDSLYVQAIARHLLASERQIEVCSDWPDVFRPLGDRVKVSSFRRQRIDRLAHYAQRRGVQGTTQFEDCCLSAGIVDPVDLRLDWRIVDRDLAARALGGDGNPVIAVMLPRAPMGRRDGFGAELLPDCQLLQRAVDRLGDEARIIQIGAGSPLHQFSGIDLDLANRTSVSDLLDVSASVDGFLGYPSFVIPLAESLGKPALIIWSGRGLRSPHLVIRQMTPAKLLNGHLCRAVVDDGSSHDLDRALDAFSAEIRTPALV